MFGIHDLDSILSAESQFAIVKASNLAIKSKRNHDFESLVVLTFQFFQYETLFLFFFNF